MVFRFNEHSLDLGDLTVDETKFHMTNETSYVDKFVKMYKTSANYRNALLPLKIQCLLNIKEKINNKYESYLDLLAGLGISGRIFEVPGASYLNDFCPVCLGILDRNFSDTWLSQEDMFKMNIPIVDFIFADFNNFTLKRGLSTYKPVLDSIFAAANKYVLINDCSIFYLKYGKASYDAYSKLLGRSAGENLFDYYTAFRTLMRELYPDWTLTDVEGFKDTCFALFTKGGNRRKELSVNINHKDDITVKTSLDGISVGRSLWDGQNVGS